MQKHLWLGTAVVALMALSAPAHAQYVEYRSSDKPSVEVNLDALNERQEQEFNAQHDVTQEPLGERRHPRVRYVRPPDVQPAPAPVQVPIRAPEPVYQEEAYEAPQPRAKRRLLKPVFTARPVTEAEMQEPVPAQRVDNGEMNHPAPVVKRSVIMSNTDDDGMMSAPEPAPVMTPEQVEQEVAQEPVEAVRAPEPEIVAAPVTTTPLPRRKPEGIKKSWSVVDGTPEPDNIPRAPVAVKAETPAPEPEIVAAPEPEPMPEPKAEVVAAPEPVAPAPAPVVSRKHVEQAYAQPAVSQYYGVPQGAIISKKPKLSNELPGNASPLPSYTPPAAQPAPEPVMSPAPVAPVVAAPVVSQPHAPLPTRAPKHEPKQELKTVHEPELAANPLPEVTAPVATPEPEVAPAPETQVATLQPPVTPEDATTSLPVVPTIADLTLEFVGSSSDLTAASQGKLDNVIRQMADSIEGRLQVRGYATGEDGSQTSARRIALSRALSVRSYLMDKGIKPTRVDVRALGTQTERAPLDRVDLIFAK